MKKKILCFIFITSCCFCFAQSISEKKAALNEEPSMDRDTRKIFEKINKDISSYKSSLEKLQTDILKNFNDNIPSEKYRDKIDQMQLLQKQINETSKKWYKEISYNPNENLYALWSQPNSSIAQLVLDYASQKHIYLIPPEIFDIPINLVSSLPMPSESWDEALHVILKQSGIGIRELRPYLRELFFLENKINTISAVTNKREDLDILPDDANICYIFSPSNLDVSGTKTFLDKLTSSSKINVQIVNHNVFLIGSVIEIKELLKIYNFIDQDSFNKNYKFISLLKTSPREISTILESIFINYNDIMSTQNSMKIIPLEQSDRQGVFIFASSEEIARAEEIIADIERDIEGASGKIINIYTCENSDPEELATILSKAYALIKESSGEMEISEKNSHTNTLSENTNVNYDKPEESLVINPAPIMPNKMEHKTEINNRNNFIVDPKTNSIIMVVERNVLPMLKNLLVKLDIPKKMVHIEVLLFEKKISNSNNFGLNILRLGQKASGSDESWSSWSAKSNVNNVLDSTDKLAARQGIFDFFISRKKRGHTPSFDLAYSFLMSQEDVTVHSSPSVSTVNQTTASIKLVEEVSIKTGAIIQGDENSKDTYARNQYGVTIEITPTIHEHENYDYNNVNFITLDTDITFDDTPTTVAGQPNITRRNIKNQVRIEDGQTVILGGLRRKNSDDKKNHLPFLGEIPGFGKLFSETQLSDSSKEMFIFITPKIVTDEQDKLKIMQKEMLKWRPGDNPEFLDAILKAKASQKQRMFENSLTMLFGREQNN